MTRSKHILALVISLATAVLPLWVDASQTLVGKITGSIVTALLLGVSTEKLKSQRNAILGGLAVAAIVATAVMGKFSSGTLGLAIVGNVLAVLTQLRVVLARQLADDSTAALAIVQQAGSNPALREKLNIALDGSAGKSRGE